MIRTILRAAPVALALGGALVIVNCSSSSTTINNEPDAGHTSTSGKTSGSKSSGGSSSEKTSGSKSEGSSSENSSVSNSSVSSSGAGSSAASGAIPAYKGPSKTGAAIGDQPTTCKAPAGGATCSPGTVTCGGATSDCDLSKGNYCCDATPEVCQSTSKPCPDGTPITCNEAADCADGEVCCIASTGVTANTATVSCQKLVAGACPAAPIASAQICRSDAECASGKCQFWSCAGHSIEACSSPNASLCQLAAADGG